MSDPILTRASERVRITMNICQDAMEMLSQAVEELRGRVVELQRPEGERREKE